MGILLRSASNSEQVALASLTSLNLLAQPVSFDGPAFVDFPMKTLQILKALVARLDSSEQLIVRWNLLYSFEGVNCLSNSRRRKTENYFAYCSQNY